MPASFSYDANANTIQKLEGGVTTQYTYNAEERMIGVSDDAVQVGAYVYNPYGQRVRKVAQGETTYFLYNLNGMAAEYDASGALVKEYHFNPQAPWMTEPLFQRTAGGEIYYYQNDHLGAPQKLIGKSGALAWAGRWSAFGEVSVVGGGLTESALRFPGQYGDGESGLSQNYFRDYGASYGRYLQNDPVGLDGGLNNFAYSLQNPVNFYDPTGRFVPAVAACMLNPACVALVAEALTATAQFVVEAVVVGISIYSWMDGDYDDGEWDHDGDNHDLENMILEEPVTGGMPNCDENKRKLDIMNQALNRQSTNKANGQSGQGYGTSNQHQVHSHKPRINKIKNKIKELERATEDCDDDEPNCAV